MNNTYFNSQLDKALAIGILLFVLVAGLVFAKYIYLNQITTFVDEIEFGKKKSAKVNTILADEKNLQRQIHQKKSQFKKDRIFLTNTNPANAASELQNYIKRLIATQSRAKILTIKPYPVLAHDDYYETSLEIRLKGIGHKDIQKILYMIESRSPVLLVKEIDIRRPQLQYKSLVPKETKEINFGVTMVVSGFFRGSAA